MRCLKRYVAREAYRALMHPHEVRRPEDASELVAARRAAKVSQVRAATILGTSERCISMLERGQRELKPIRRAYEAWVEAGLPLDWDRQAFEALRLKAIKAALENVGLMNTVSKLSLVKGQLINIFNFVTLRSLLYFFKSAAIVVIKQSQIISE